MVIGAGELTPGFALRMRAVAPLVMVPWKMSAERRAVEGDAPEMPSMLVSTVFAPIRVGKYRGVAPPRLGGEVVGCWG